MSLTVKYKITHKLFPLKISILYNLCMYVSPFFFAMGKRYWTEKQPWYIKPTIKKLDYVNFKLLIPEKTCITIFKCLVNKAKIDLPLLLYWNSFVLVGLPMWQAETSVEYQIHLSQWYVIDVFWSELPIPIQPM